MMDFISHWLRGLILLIFLAIILDMILPNNAFQRYAKVVMGLMIIFLMLTPVMKLYGQSGNLNNISIDSLLHESNHSMEGLDEIEKQGQKIQLQNANLTAEQWKAVIVEGVKLQVEQNNNVTVKNVNVKYTVDDAGKPKSLDGLQVTVMPKVDPHQVQPVKPIDPIEINGESQTQPDQPAVSQGDSTKTAAIRSEIAGEYQLNPAQVTVVWQDS
ncbi:MAG: stage III sporulation protein AF [Tumebacillaceae bacterium]